MSVIFNEPGGGGSGGGGDQNPRYQNGVAHFVQTTKPTERSAGVALVAGDRWYNTSDGTEWFWNGTYWLSSLEYELVTAGANNISVTTNLGVIKTPSPAITSESNAVGQINIFITRCIFQSRELVVNNANDHWTLTLGSQNGFGTNVGLAPSIPVVTSVGAVSQGSVGLRKSTNISLLLTAVPYNITATATKVGSPSNLVAHFIYCYRPVYI